MAKERALFVTRLGGILAAVGSAVGLGNIWRFPTETGANGGAAFLLVYLGCVLLLGTPLMMAELMLGRASHRNAAGAMRQLAPGTLWYLWGYAGSLTMLFIIAFYSVVAGWTLHYSVTAFANCIPDFTSYSSGLWMPLFYITLFFVLNAVILLGGVTKGIERASNVMMPLLGLLLLVLCVNSLLLPDASQGLRFLFEPDFSKITPQVIVSALGQSFFSISCGIGCLLTYGSYLPDNTRLAKTSLSITLLDSLIAILSGVVIFPACFSFGVTPDAGPGLAFITLPEVFGQMHLGYIWSILFFLLLVLAALTSSISMLEGPIAILQEEFHLSRRTSVITATLIGWVLGLLCCVSFCPDYKPYLQAFGLSMFELFDHVTACYFMPLLGLLMSLFVGWKLPRRFVEEQFTNQGTTSGWFVPAFLFIVRYFAPLCILAIFLNQG